MSEPTRLEHAFQRVRKICFPRWDPANQWKVHLDPHLPPQGKCLSERKQISVRELPRADKELDLLLVHEICHSSAPHHGNRWRERMQRARECALPFGDTELSNLITAELGSYKQSERITAAGVYNLMEDFLISYPEASYESVVKAIAKEFGLYPAELERRFKRIKKVFRSIQVGT